MSALVKAQGDLHTNTKKAKPSISEPRNDRKEKIKLTLAT